MKPLLQLLGRRILSFYPSGVFILCVAIVYINGCVSDSSRNGNQPDINSDTSSDTIYKELPVDSATYFQGEALFIRDCNVCHVTKDRLHNYLEGVVGRVGKDYLKLYLTKQDSLTSAKDTIAMKLKKVWGNMANSHNFEYTEVDLTAIIEYLK